jgi:glycosyltransferase involved in cell wall biosynthesis
MTAPIRLTAVLTHPAQYHAPWFRHITAHCHDLDLTVLYATTPGAEQQGVGFGIPFHWDVALTAGYRCRVVRPARPGESVHSDAFRGLDVAEIGPALAESRPDVALVPGWHSVTLLRALWACRRARVPVLYRGDTHLGTAPRGWRRPVWSARTRWLLRRFDAHLAVGRRARDYLLALGADPSRVFDAPHCVDNDFFAARAAPHQTPAGRWAARVSLGFESGDFVVLFVGKLEPKKRPLDLVRAVARLGGGVRLLVVGAGELERAARAEAERLGVRAVWTGFLNQRELGRAYAAADCLALPSDWGETWGLVVNEALATGLPCVVSDRVGCGPDLVVRGATGEVFPMGDVPALAAALEGLRARRQHGHDWGPACRRQVSAYSLARAADGLVAACRAVTGDSRRRRPGRSRSDAPRVVACCGGMVVVSGLERMTFEVLRALAERGAAVHCIVNSWENERIVPLAEAITASWSIGRYRQRPDRHARDPAALARLGWDVSMTSLGLLRDAWRLRATHVLLPEYVAVLRNAPALALLRALRRTVLLHVLNPPAPGAFHRRLWRYAVAPLVSHLVCCSAHTRQAVVDLGIRADKTSLIYNVAPRRNGSGPAGAVRDPRAIIYVGQVIPEKGLDLLLEALGLVLCRGRDARLVVVGAMDGWISPAYHGYRERLLRRAGAPDLAGRVEFLGWREDVPTLLAGASVHCCPSRPEMREGLPLVCLEAKLAGLPSVAFPGGPFAEIIEHGVDGWICRDVNAAALADGLEYFLADPARLERGRGAARASAARFGRARFADAWWRTVRPTEPAS